jgi:hypothetical protein
MNKLEKTCRMSKNLLLVRFEESGIETKKSGKILSRVNPLDKLYTSSDLTKDEWLAGKEYQKNYELANISNHARPSYENWGTSKSTKITEFTPKNFQIKAYSKITEAKLEISKEYRLLEILTHLFENQQSINHCEKLLKTNHKIIKEKIKKICKILLAI